MRKLIATTAVRGAPHTTALLARADQALESVDRQLAMLETTWDLFLPFVAGERFIFQCKHTRELWAQLSEDDRAKLRGIGKRSMRQYWMEVHMRASRVGYSPGSRREEGPQARGGAAKDLLALLAASVHAFGRGALRFLCRRGRRRGAGADARRPDLLRRAGPVLRRAGRALQARGVKRATRAADVRKPPEWAMAISASSGRRGRRSSR